MEMAIGMSQSEADDTSWRGTNEGAKLKATSGWHNNGNGTDDFGFSALPGGYRVFDGSFDRISGYSYWWSATEQSSDRAWYRSVGFANTDMVRYYNSKDYCFSVRYVRDN